MIKGDIFLTTDINTAIQISVDPSTVIIFLEEEHDLDPNLLKPNNCICGGVLLPDYQSFMAQIDQGREQFEKCYFEYLSTYEPTTLILILIKAMCNGKNIILFADNSHSEKFIPELLKYFGIYFGIMIGTLNQQGMILNQSGFDLRYLRKISEMLYLQDLYSVQELFEDFPQGEYFSQNVVVKLVNDLNPYLKKPNPTFDDYNLYLYNYKEQVKSKGKFLKTIVRR